MTRRLPDAAIGPLLVAPAVLLLAGVVAWPLVSALWLSLHALYTPTLEGPWVGLGNYAAVAGDGAFWRALLRTLTWTAGTLSLQLVLGIGFALLLHREMRMRGLARGLVLFPYFVSTVVAVLVWRWLLNDLYGLVNQLLLATGLRETPVDFLGTMPNAMLSAIAIGAWKFFPFVTIAVLARLQTIPDKLYDAARLDGAGAWDRFRDVTLPELGQVLGIVVLLRAIWDFKEFDLVFLLTGGGPVDATRTLPLLVYQQAFGLNQMGLAAAHAVAMMLVMLLFAGLWSLAMRVRA